MNELKIKNSVPVQENFEGNGAVYHGYAGMPDHCGRVYTEEQCIIEAKRATDMKLKIARTFYGWWAWDEASKSWNWDNERMKPFYRWLQRMKDGGVTVALNTGWCSPGDINSTSWNGKSPFTVEGDWEASLKNYGDWVSETVNQLIIKRGFDNIKIFVMFTEPTRHSGKHEKAPFDGWYDAVKAAHDALVRDGRRDLIKFMGANEGSGVTSHMLKWAAENADDMIDIYSSHTYQHQANIPNSYKKSGKFAAVFAQMPGGRIARTVEIKPNTDYVLKSEVFFKKAHNEKSEGGIHFGAFIDDGRGDIHIAEGNGPNFPLAPNSVITVNPDDLSEDYSFIEVKFNSGDATSTVIGLFHDVFSKGMTCVDYFSLTEAGSDENIIPNGDFSKDYDGWLVLFGGGVRDAYFDWYKWAKTGLQYVPKGKPYCFDEYNVVFDRDNSRALHGSEIVTIAVALMNAGVNSSLLWTLFDQQWPNNHATNSDSFYDGDHRCGVASLLSRSLIPHKSYYAFSLISKYVDSGSKVYEGVGEDCLHTTMSVSKNGDITIIVVNGKDVGEEFKINFEKSLEGVSFNCHIFNPETCVPDEKAEIIGSSKVLNSVTNSLSDYIAPYGVTVYTTLLD